MNSQRKIMKNKRNGRKEKQNRHKSIIVISHHNPNQIYKHSPLKTQMLLIKLLTHVQIA